MDDQEHEVVLAADTGTLTITREPFGLGLHHDNAPEAAPELRVRLTERQRHELLGRLLEWTTTNRLFVVEGIDGSGKNTVAQRLAQRVGGAVLAFPSLKTQTGPSIRQYLRGEMTEASGPLGFQALQFVNRIEHLDELWDPVVPLVLVRYWQSGLVYGHLDGLDWGFLTKIHRVLPRARCNVFLDVPTDTAIGRLSDRTQREIYENPTQMHRVAQLYRDLWGTHGAPGWRIVDATQPIDTIVDELFDLWLQKPLL